MKREIKFRAWGKVEKKLCLIDVLTDQGAFLIGVEPGKDEVIPEIRAVIRAPQNGRFLPFQEIEIMQYTGLKDKNNKEIYDRDICRTKRKIYLVEWGISSYHLIPINGTGSNWCLNSYNSKYLEVIGNIYENPELLKE